MKNNSKSSIGLNTILAVCLIAIGLLVNPGLLRCLFASLVGDDIAIENKIIIWAFEALCIVSGLLVYLKGNTPEKRKQLLFILVTITLMVIMLEAGLHVAYLVLDLGDSKDMIENKRYLRSPYHGKEWAQTLFKELREVPKKEYQQFLGWGKEEYHGKYVNVDSWGIRKSWNPTDFHGKQPQTIYMFGGSTVLGIGARDDYTIPSLLSKMLHGKGYDVVVYNYGELAYTYTQEVILLILLLRDGHRPDYVIFYDGISDVYSAYQTGSAGFIQNLSEIRDKLKAKKPTPLEHIGIAIRDLLKGHCMIYNAVRKIPAYYRKPQFQESASKYTDEQLMTLAHDITEYYMQSKDLLDRLAKAYDFKYICFWQPVMLLEERLINDEAEADRRLHDKALTSCFKYTMASLAKRPSRHFFDITDALYGRTESCYIDFAHLSEEGNEMVSTKIADIFEKEFLSDE